MKKYDTVHEFVQLFLCCNAAPSYLLFKYFFCLDLYFTFKLTIKHTASYVIVLLWWLPYIESVVTAFMQHCKCIFLMIENLVKGGHERCFVHKSSLLESRIKWLPYPIDDMQIKWLSCSFQWPWALCTRGAISMVSTSVQYLYVAKTL